MPWNGRYGKKYHGTEVAETEFVTKIVWVLSDDLVALPDFDTCH